MQRRRNKKISHIIREIEALLNTKQSLLRFASGIQHRKLASEQFLKSLEEQQDLASKINRQIQPYKQALASVQFAKEAYQPALVSRQFAENFLETRLRTIEMIWELIEVVPEREKKGLQILGEEGWFFDPEMHSCLFLQKRETLLNRDPKELLSQLNNYCVDLFREQLDNIEKNLPTRTHIATPSCFKHLMHTAVVNTACRLRHFFPKQTGFLEKFSQEKAYLDRNNGNQRLVNMP